MHKYTHNGGDSFNLSKFFYERKNTIFIKMSIEIKLKILYLKNRASSVNHSYVRSIRSIFNIFMEIFLNISLFCIHFIIQN